MPEEEKPWIEHTRQLTPTHVQCKKCGRFNSRYRQTCWNCGEEL
jgi:uncharacterized OB-fold protein